MSIDNDVIKNRYLLEMTKYTSTFLAHVKYQDYNDIDNLYLLILYL